MMKQLTLLLSLLLVSASASGVAEGEISPDGQAITQQQQQPQQQQQQQGKTAASYLVKGPGFASFDADTVDVVALGKELAAVSKDMGTVMANLFACQLTDATLRTSKLAADTAPTKKEVELGEKAMEMWETERRKAWDTHKKTGADYGKLIDEMNDKLNKVHEKQRRIRDRRLKKLTKRQQALMTSTKPTYCHFEAVRLVRESNKRLQSISKRLLAAWPKAEIAQRRLARPQLHMAAALFSMFDEFVNKLTSQALQFSSADMMFFLPLQPYKEMFERVLVDVATKLVDVKQDEPFRGAHVEQMLNVWLQALDGQVQAYNKVADTRAFRRMERKHRRAMKKQS